MRPQGMQPQGVQVQGMGDGISGVEGRNTEVGGGPGDFDIDTGNKGRDAGADSPEATRHVDTSAMHR